MAKIDLFQALEYIDKNDHQYISSLSEEEIKQLSSFMVFKWMANTNSPDKLMMLNVIANKRIFQLYKYPQLVLHLLSSCGDGNREFYKWKRKKYSIKKRPITVDLLKEYYGISNKAALEDSEVMDLESIVVIAEELGHFDKIDKLMREY